MGNQICYVILSRSNRNDEVAVAEVYMDKRQSESRLAELSNLFRGYNTFELQSAILVTPDVNE